jgi:hypothetical protein
MLTSLICYLWLQQAPIENPKPADAPPPSPPAAPAPVEAAPAPEAPPSNPDAGVAPPPAVAPPAPPPAAPPPPPPVVAPPAPPPAVRVPGATLLNPALSVILDGAFGYYGVHGDDFAALGLPISSDDPPTTPEGFSVPRIELAAEATIDPHLEGAVFLTVPNLHGLEVDEAYLATTSLPANLAIKAGSFRSQVGRNNTQHLHMQSFTRRPLMTPLLFGPDGLRGPGAQVSVRLPLPWFATLFGEAFSIGAPEDQTRLATFGGGARLTPSNLTYTAVLEQRWALGDSISIQLGANFATGRVFDCMQLVPCSASVAAGPRSFLYGGDLYFSWKPPGQTQTLSGLQWTTEWFARSITGGGPTEGAGYTEPVLQIAQRLYVGARFDLVGLPSSTDLPSGTNLPRRYGYAASLTVAPSEFSRIRLYGQELTGGGQYATVGFLQFEYSMGAHGAHPY